MEASQAAIKEAAQPEVEFIRQIVRLTKDGECSTCGKDGFDENPICTAHEPFDMPNDDAVETLHSLIEDARAIQTGSEC